MTTRAHEILRALRRTGMAHESVQESIERLLVEVHPTQDDLLEALADAQNMSDTDPARHRLIELVTASLRSGRYLRT